MLKEPALRRKRVQRLIRLRIFERLQRPLQHRTVRRARRALELLRQARPVEPERFLALSAPLLLRRGCTFARPPCFFGLLLPLQRLFHSPCQSICVPTCHDEPSFPAKQSCSSSYTRKPKALLFEPFPTWRCCQVARHQSGPASLLPSHWLLKITSTYPDQPLHRLNQLLRIVADAVFEDDFHLLYVTDVRRRVTFDDHQVRLLADGD